MKQDPGGPDQPGSTAAADRRLFIGGGASIALIVAGVVLRLAGVLPSGVATVVILLVAGIGLRLFVRYAAKSASSIHRTRITKLISLAGLAVSLVTLVAALPVLLRGGGASHFTANVVAHLWTLLILVLVVGGARTLGWQTLFGMGVTAFLGVSGLAYAIGRPVISALGTQSTFATVVFVPFTEEVLKALPALIVLLVAVRSKRMRPSAVEMALLGACLGAGFALYEDAQFHRGGFDWSAMPLMSFLNPTAYSDHVNGVTYVAAGHLVFTALIVFGLAISVLYRHQLTWAKYAIPVAFFVATGEHITQNYSSVIAAGHGSSALFDLLRVLTLWGWLSSLLLVGGIVWFARRERRAASGEVRVPLQQSIASSFWLRPAAAQQAAAALASAQVPVASGAAR